MSESGQYFAPDWVRDAVFYQIFPDRFCNGDPANDPQPLAVWGDVPTRENFFGGDLAGVLHQLDYLQELGINAIYLNPIFAAQTNHRYDTSDYFQVDPRLGDRDTLLALVSEMHRRGMHLILDGVFNHCGLGFAPFQDVLANGERSEYRDWFVARSYPLRSDPLNFLTCGGCTYLPKLNHAYRPVQEFILKVAAYWLEEVGIDGWRLDVPFKIPLPFWREFRATVKRINSQAYLVGEVWREAAPWIEGTAFDGVTNYRLRDILFDYALTHVLDGEDFGYELSTLLTAHGPAAASMLNLLDSHDTQRLFTTCKGDLDVLRILLTAQMTLPGAPLIYYGDEVGLPGENDPDCRRCMPWDEAVWNQPLRRLFQQLIALRRQHLALRRGQPQKLAAFNGVYAYRMSAGSDEALVVLNPREAIADFALPTLSSEPRWQGAMTGAVYIPEAGVLHLPSIPAGSAEIYFPCE
jgi:glycosidase